MTITKQNQQYKALPVEAVLIRYGELSLKGKNRSQFEQRLADNIKEKMMGLGVELHRSRSRLQLTLNEAPVDEVLNRLQDVFGISSFSPAYAAPLEVEAIQETAYKAIEMMDRQVTTFKVNVKRSNKRFPLNSQEMNHRVGGYILKRMSHLKVDVHKPQLELLIEIRDEAAYIMPQKIKGAGGLPVGSSGKAMLMLSGGIDSPVAGYLCLKRGIRIEGVHFHSFPFTSERAQQKAIDLARQLARYAGQIKLHMVPFTTIQTEIKKHIPDPYSITIMRRFMVRITEQLARRRRALGIATGESVGQVASQTLESMYTIGEVTDLPILRPVVTMDKVEIIELAKKIDTYDISIQPYEDCCTVFQPKNPKTKPDRSTAARLEERLAVKQLVDEAVAGTEILTIKEMENETDFDHLF